MFTLATFSQPVPTKNKQSTIKTAQETIYHFIYDSLIYCSPETAIAAFKSLFIDPNPQTNKKAIQALHQILLTNQETAFRLTLKRSFFLIINNIEPNQREKAIQELITTLSTTNKFQHKKTSFPAIYQLRTWLKRFTTSREYEDIKLFGTQAEEHWTQRYRSYLLIRQFLDIRNPLEQREAAQFKAKQLKEQYKFNLAMYTARCQSPGNRNQEHLPPNPTLLEDEFLQIIKLILIRKGQFSHENLARIFRQQIQQQTFANFKETFLSYLISAIQKPELIQQIQPIIVEKFALLEAKRDPENLQKPLLLQTCKKTIDYLLIENSKRPSQLFILLLSQGDPILLVRLLIKIILVCPAAQTHLELRIANLINYYKRFSAVECQWIINFLEVLNIALAIYSDNVKYELIKVNSSNPETSVADLNAYRVFSYYKKS
ncbi:MAG: hypothetical protein SAJ37_14550 [Oscillatoria sp. PMC 1068.18]|nr:hypothetical protein [Oscillatoria sp. PMC 1076.18]MEC4989948.1 hypothetical protein [Oscillatoria sp. PMC 1068.18]